MTAQQDRLTEMDVARRNDYLEAAADMTIVEVARLLADYDHLVEVLTEIADWDAHNEDCAVIDPRTGHVTDKDCSCGWVEVADTAREALGLEPIGYPQSRARALIDPATPEPVEGEPNA